MELREVIRILRKHNDTGKTVLHITKGRHYEQALLRQLLDESEDLIKQNANLLRLLKAASDDFKLLGDSYLKNPTIKDIIVDKESHRWRYADIVTGYIEEAKRKEDWFDAI